MAEPTILSSEDSGAPVLSGAAGSIVPVLDYALDALGWTKLFGTSTKGAYQMPDGTGSILRAELPAHGLVSGTLATLRGYETMSDIDTGTGPFPTETITACGIWTALNPTGLDDSDTPWRIIGDGRGFLILTKPLQQPEDHASWMGAWFGDFNPVTTDPYACGAVLCGSKSGTTFLGFAVDTSGMEPSEPVSVRRKLDGTAGSIVSFTGTSEVAWIGDRAKYAAPNAGLLPRPNPSDDSVFLSPITWVENTGTFIVRGRQRGLWHWNHLEASAVDDEIIIASETSALAGKRFQIFAPLLLNQAGGPGSTAGVYAVDLSDWDV